MIFDTQDGYHCIKIMKVDLIKIFPPIDFHGELTSKGTPNESIVDLSSIMLFLS